MRAAEPLTLRVPPLPRLTAGVIDRRRLVWLGWIGLGLASLLLRAGALHSGLLYPDGYDYLLMARGIAAHLQPTLHLGPGGMLFSPPLDAAVKPMFPALTALLGLVLPLRSAADCLTVAGGAATVVLTGMVVRRLTGSELAGLSAGALALFSPALGFWSGFTGPDALAPALALATVLLALSDRATAAGVMAGVCIATRPEWALAALVLLAAAVARRRTRAAAANAAIAGAFTLALIFGVLRPPLGAHLTLHAPAGARTALGSTAVSTLLRDDWPLLLLSAGGVICAAARGLGRQAGLLVAAITLLATAYLTKNPGSERYLSQLIPLLCICAGIALSAFPARLVAVATPIALAALITATAAMPAVGGDPFARIAARLQALRPATVVTAAPEAYGYLLPRLRIGPMTPGARGTIVLDGAQRMYAPRLSAHGHILTTVAPGEGFERPDGTLDNRPARVVRGLVTVRTG